MSNKIVIILLTYAILFTTFLQADNEATSLEEIILKAKTSGNVRYYYIQTDKDFSNKPSTSASSNSLGGHLSLETANYYGFNSKVTFMTTNPFLLPDNVETSLIGKYNGSRGYDATKGFSILGESYIAYSHENFSINYGRKVVKTPFINAKDVRMIPSTVEGTMASFNIDSLLQIDISLLDKFKQRTSDVFMNIVKHALGDKTKEVTGHDTGSVAMIGLTLKKEAFKVKYFDYYSEDFMNSIYTDLEYSTSINNVAMNFKAQYLNQISVGNADTNLDKAGSITNGKVLSVHAFGTMFNAKLHNTTIALAYSQVLRNSDVHDSLVLAWDGTPLFTNTITSNNLFQSLYGKGFNADSIYIGGSEGIKLQVSQKLHQYVEGMSVSASYLNTSNGRQGFDKNQEDYNLVVAYKYNKHLSLATKGIWVHNDSSMDATGLVSQKDLLSQYRVIANYKF